jgi:hypothetical protein
MLYMRLCVASRLQNDVAVPRTAQTRTTSKPFDKRVLFATPWKICSNNLEVAIEAIFHAATGVAGAICPVTRSRQHSMPKWKHPRGKWAICHQQNYLGVCIIANGGSLGAWKPGARRN